MNTATRMLMLALLVAAAALPAAAQGDGESPAPPSAHPLPGTWAANGPVWAVEGNAHAVYVGGNFSFVGPATGHTARLGAAAPDPAPEHRPPLHVFPQPNGTVYACIPDGEGGWYIGGNFTAVMDGLAGNVPRERLARIRPNLTVDPDWNPGANRTVYALALDEDWGLLYVGGNFSLVDGHYRDFLCAIDANRASPGYGTVTDWLAPAVGALYPGPNDFVRAMLLVRGAEEVEEEGEVHDRHTYTLYVGGNFTDIGDHTRNYIAAFEADAGRVPGLDTPAYGELLDWNPSANGAVRAMTWAPDPDEPENLEQGLIYVGGWFTSIGFSQRRHVAALQAHPESVGLATDWNPDANNPVYALAVAADRSVAYAGGAFSRIGDADRLYIAALGADPDHEPEPDPDPEGEPEPPPDIFGKALDWAPQTDDWVTALGLSPDSADAKVLYAGGRFRQIGAPEQPNPSLRHHLAALIVDDGSPDYGSAAGWNPGAGAAPLVLLPPPYGGNAVVAAGEFTTVNGRARNNLAAFGADPGGPHYRTANDWNPNADDVVLALRVAPLPEGAPVPEEEMRYRVYAGGVFNAVGGLPRMHLAAIDADHTHPNYPANYGNVLAWNPGASRPGTLPATVHALALSPDNMRLYAGGEFEALGAHSRSHVAEFERGGDDEFASIPTGWAPDDLPGEAPIVYDLAVSDNTVYAGGRWLAETAPLQRGFVYAMETLPGGYSWGDDAVNGSVQALALYDHGAHAGPNAVLYAGGHFTQISGEQRHRLGALRADNGGLIGIPWHNIWLDGAVHSLYMFDSAVVLFVGGNFKRYWDYTNNREASRHRVMQLDANPTSDEFGMPYDIGDEDYWNPRMDSPVYNFEVEHTSAAGYSLYVGGGFRTTDCNFNDIRGRPRSHFARFSLYPSPAPFVTDVAVVDGWTVDVTFSDSMGPSALIAENYYLSGSGQGTLTDSPNSVAQTDAWTYRLSWACPALMYDGGDITVRVSVFLENAVGVPVIEPMEATHVGGAVADAPVITLGEPGSEEMTVECGFPFIDPVSAMDACGTDITAGIDDGDVLDTEVVGLYTITYNVSDAAGNEAEPATRIVEVVDTTAPEITLIGEPEIIVERGDVYIDEGAMAWDACDGDLTDAIVVVGDDLVDTDTPGEYLITYNVSDSEGNAADEAVRIVHVVDPNMPYVENVRVIDGWTVDVTFSRLMSADALDVMNYTVSGSGRGTLSLHPISVSQLPEPDEYTYRLTWACPDIMLNGGDITITVLETVEDEEGNAMIEPWEGTHFGGAVADAPGIVLLGDDPLIIECRGSFEDPGAVLEDACGNSIPDVVFDVDDSGVDVNVVGVYTVIYSTDATDEAGNPVEADAERIVEVEDTIPPVLTLGVFAPEMIDADGYVLNECADDFIEPDGFAAEDECVGDLGMPQAELEADTPGVITYAWALDDDGNLLWQDDEPVLWRLDAFIGAPGNYLLLYEAHDGNGNVYPPLDEAGLPPIFDENEEPDFLDEDGRLRDGIDFARLVRVLDTGAPEITLLGDDVIDIECGEPFEDPGATAWDDCEGDLTDAVVVGGDVVDSSVVGTYIITYDVSDAQGHAAPTQTRTVEVTDTLPPVITLLGDDDIELECGEPFEDPGATAWDDCDGDLTDAVVVGGDVVDSSVVGIYIITYDVSDAQGHAAPTQTRTVTVTDTLPPVITLLGDEDIEFDCGEPFEDPGATAWDGCDGDLTDAVVVGGDVVDSSVPGTYIITYDVSDAQGNAAPTQTRTVTVTDTLPPVVEIDGPDTLTGECGVPLELPAATAEDECDGPLPVEITDYDGLDVDNPEVGTYTVEYSATDSANNTGTALLTVTIEDTERPVITLLGEQVMYVECGDELEPGWTAWDNCDGDLTDAVVVTRWTSSYDRPRSVLFTYNVTDSAGNTAVQVWRVVTEEDTIPPELTLGEFGPEHMDEDGFVLHECDDAFVEPDEFLAFDVCQGDLGGVQPRLDGTVPGVTAFAWVLDEALEPQWIDYEGRVPDLLDYDMFVNVGGAYLLFYIAWDRVWGEVGNSYPMLDADGLPPIFDENGEFNYVDEEGNLTVDFVRLVRVEDTEAPVITLLGDDPMEIECGHSFDDPGATAWDACDGDLTAAIVVGGDAVDTGTPGTYHVTYNVSDAAGNAAEEITRTVNVVDTEAPVITLLGDDPLLVECGYPFDDPGATAWDACRGDLTADIVPGGDIVNTGALGVYEVVYNVSDAAGNAAEAVTRTVEVMDTTPPELYLGEFAPEQTDEDGFVLYECGGDFIEPEDFLAYDACDGDLGEVQTLLDDGAAGVTAYAWVLDDALEPQWIDYNGRVPDLLAYDAFANITGAYLLYYMARDSQGNAYPMLDADGLPPILDENDEPDFLDEDGKLRAGIDFARLVWIQDTTPPVIEVCAPNQTINVDELCAPVVVPDFTGNVVATDNCTPSVALVITQDPEAGAVVGLGEHPIAITVRDAEDNTAACTAVLTVQDTMPPVIISCPDDSYHAEVEMIDLGGGEYEYTAPIPDFTGDVEAEDNCGPITIIQTPEAGSRIYVDTEVTLTARDGAGNESETDCSVLVTVDATFHPADVNEDWFIDMEEAMDYVLGWQEGINPMSYALRAVLIWESGGFYMYDPGQTCPSCWEPVLKSGAAPVSSDTGKVLWTVREGDSYILIEPHRDAIVWGFEMYLPEDIVVKAVYGENARWDRVNHRLTWWAISNETAVVGFEAQGLSGVDVLAGQVSFGGGVMDVTSTDAYFDFDLDDVAGSDGEGTGAETDVQDSHRPHEDDAMQIVGDGLEEHMIVETDDDEDVPAAGAYDKTAPRCGIIRDELRSIRRHLTDMLLIGLCAWVLLWRGKIHR